MALCLCVTALAGWPGARARADDAPPTATAARTTTIAHPSSLDIMEFYVEGNSVLDETVIDDAVEPFLGPQRTPDDVDKARAALESAYRDRGYKTVSVTIPRQNVKDGVVHLQVVEGRIEHLDVVNSHYHSIDAIKQQAPSVAEGQVPNFNELQSDLVALNQQQDQRVTPSLKAGSTPGTVDLDLVVDDQLPLHGSVELNNRKSQGTHELRTTGTVSYDNLWQAGHSLTVSYQTAPQNQSEARVLFASYLIRNGASPLSILLNALKSDSNVATVGDIDVVGKGQSGGIRGILQLDGTQHYSPLLTFGVDYKHFRSITALGSQPATDTPVEYWPFTIDYSGVYRGADSTTQGDLSVVFAPRGLGSSSPVLDQSRFTSGYHQQLFYFRQTFSHTRDLPHGLQFFGRWSSQLADGPLISNEQFNAGGLDSVRGYLEAEVLGDYGFDGSLELRSHSWVAPPLEQLQLFAFVDGARLALHDPLPGQLSRFSLASLGAGANLKLYSYLNANLVWADPMIAASATHAWDSRVLFRLWTSF